MTTRDPRSRDPKRPDSSGHGRDPTQSLSLPPDEEDDDEPAHPSLALGTHEASNRDERTKIESPGARGKTPAPPSRSVSRPPPLPKGSDEPERVGSVLGSYRVLELLGKGGMGYVFRAEHTKLGREVALKLLRVDYARRRDAVARFIQEARLVNRIRHRNIVDVPDIVELEDGTTFIVMEFLRGTSLGKWARTGIDLPRALAVLVQICDGLAAAHQVGVVHRDLKPDNVIVVPTSDGAELVKLLDFGVAKLLNRDDEDIGFQTAAGSVIGTPAYMSPEQAGGMVIDARSDIYSLGAIMYELFCGQPMFRGRSFGEYVRKHLTEQPVPPRSTQGGAQVDPRLEVLILKCLEKDPNLRFGHIFELRDALIGMLGGIETHPPGFAALTATGVRPPPSAVQSFGPPLGPPMMSSVLPPAQIPHAPTPAHTSGLSGMHPSQIYGYTNYSQVAPPREGQVTPWWVWFVGGALAVGLGIGAAVWYAGSSDTQRVAEPARAVPVTQPSTEPIEPAPRGQQLVEVKFDSLPSGAVYADGESAELCRTPCAFNLDLKDGKSTTTRTFVIKSAGYKDGSIVVDLTSQQLAHRITLEQASQTIPTVTQRDLEPETEKAETGKKGKKAGKKTGKTDDKAKVDDKAVPASDKTAAPTDKPLDKTDPDQLIDPTDGKPIKIKKPPVDKNIDPTDTLDPFRRKR